ncbi:outer membrane protein assembly factor BamE [Chitinilyticum piscinae]|uniref:Outer membrane protein assembly factor BamE n=1 Tax=Chitinilyticum piscinae TaxID=2866724 RepID=A0A8J7KBX2_9NEIS|nr:outer membrane protein assembly factor BamE [Chitinilyticum piscinae]MBE9610669.1 outer membrane protein assembly factor BamE [Chitinilyticum piscinae]
MKVRSLSVLLSASLLLSGCGALNWLSPYKLDIPQGNEVTADQVEQLKAGMSRGQVRFLLGTPLLQDSFHSERWDYVYSDARGGSIRERFALALYFDGDALSRWEGTSLPADPNSKFSQAKQRGQAPKLDSSEQMGGAVDPADPTDKTVVVKPLININGGE